MKKPASNACLMFKLLFLEPKAGKDTGSSIRFRISVSSERIASAV